MPTKIVQMDVDAELLANLARELLIRSKIDKAISDVAAGTYFPLSTQFENSILFLPSAQRFYQRNKEIVYEHFPEIENAVVNAFVVPPNKIPYGVHNAGAIGFQHPALARKGLGFPPIHRSFHTAITATPLDRQPLCVFENGVSESPNTSFLFEQIHSFDLDPDEAATIDKAFYLHDAGMLREMDIVSVRDFLLCKYWEKTYRSMPERAIGYFCECKPGQAVVFDNYKPHGDGTLQPSPEERITIDIRCFSKVSYPSKRVTSGADLLPNAEKRNRQKSDRLECLLLLLGYESRDEFLNLIYGTNHGEIGPFDMNADGQFGVYNKPKYNLLDQDLEPHYERCEKVYEKIERDGEFVPPDRAQKAIAQLKSV